MLSADEWPAADHQSVAMAPLFSGRAHSYLRVLGRVRDSVMLPGTVDGFGISIGTAHVYTAVVIDLLADRAPGLLRAAKPTPTTCFSTALWRSAIGPATVGRTTLTSTFDTGRTCRR
jgi:hypothetical protein